MSDATPTENAFLPKLAQELSESRWRYYFDNYDTIQRPPMPRPLWRGPAGVLFRRGKALLLATWEFAVALAQFLSISVKLLIRGGRYYLLPGQFSARMTEPYRDVGALYALLDDDASRNLLVKICAYRILGHHKVKLPRNTPQFWQDVKSLAQYNTGLPPLKVQFRNLSLPLFNFSPLGFNLKVYATAPGAACAFVQKQYEYHGAVHCKAEPGDIAIDAGGCWGETTMYFAHEVGPQGRVVVFEFMPANLAVMQKNFDNNPTLSERVTLVRQPLWSRSGQTLYYQECGPASRVSMDAGLPHDGTCQTITIDDAVKQLKLPRVDFIKMDIESAELDALNGALGTIRSFRPKLAISLYHRLSDFSTIPRLLAQLNLDYDFYLDHHTIHVDETVLFAVPRRNSAVQPVPGISSQAA